MTIEKERLMFFVFALHLSPPQHPLPFHLSLHCPLHLLHPLSLLSTALFFTFFHHPHNHHHLLQAGYGGSQSRINAHSYSGSLMSAPTSNGPTDLITNRPKSSKRPTYAPHRRSQIRVVRGPFFLLDLAPPPRPHSQTH